MSPLPTQMSSYSDATKILAPVEVGAGLYIRRCNCLIGDIPVCSRADCSTDLKIGLSGLG